MPEKEIKIEIEAQSITLKDENNNWLGQIAITSNGMLASVTDWGNFSFTWDAYGGNTLKQFKDFIVSLNISYFGQKMFQGMAYVSHARTTEKACYTYAEKILPALQLYLKENL